MVDQFTLYLALLVVVGAILFVARLIMLRDERAARRFRDVKSSDLACLQRAIKRRDGGRPVVAPITRIREKSRW